MMVKQAEKVYRSSCGMCHGGCGVLVYTQDGRITRIEGDPDSPLSKGALCAKGLASLQHVYNPARIQYPLIRTGERGEGKWKKISWDEALNGIAAQINKVKRDEGTSDEAKPRLSFQVSVCQQCEAPYCVPACPVGAIFRRKYGLIIVITKQIKEIA